MRLVGEDWRADFAGSPPAATVEGVDPERLAAAVAGDDVFEAETPTPGALCERLGAITPDWDGPVTATLAATARTRGREAPQDEAIASVREQLAAIEVEDVDREACRRRLAEAETDERRLERRVASLRGRVETLRDRGVDPSSAEADLEAAVRDLSEARTERLAAEQRLGRRRERARERRDRRERRLRLRDRLDNLRRGARERLADEVRPAVERALVELSPDRADPPGALGDVPPVAVALAAVRAGEPSAPVVVAASRFPDARTAADRLDAPVAWVDRPGPDRRS
jgi:hypothetical protein